MWRGGGGGGGGRYSEMHFKQYQGMQFVVFKVYSVSFIDFLFSSVTDYASKNQEKE